MRLQTEPAARVVWWWPKRWTVTVIICFFVYLPGSCRHLVACDSLWFPCLLSFTLSIMNTSPKSTSVLLFWVVWLPVPWASQSFSALAASAAPVTKKSATSAPDEIWSRMTLFASRKAAKGLWGVGGHPWAGWSKWSISVVAGPGGTNGPTLPVPGSLHQHAVLSCLSRVSFLPPSFPFSFLFPHFIPFPILPLSPFVIVSWLSPPSGGQSVNWW